METEAGGITVKRQNASFGYDFPTTPLFRNTCESTLYWRSPCPHRPSPISYSLSSDLRSTRPGQFMTCVKIIVVLTSFYPRSSPAVPMTKPFSSIWVANECRKVRGAADFSIPVIAIALCIVAACEIPVVVWDAYPERANGRNIEPNLWYFSFCRSPNRSPFKTRDLIFKSTGTTPTSEHHAFAANTRLSHLLAFAEIGEHLPY